MIHWLKRFTESDVGASFFASPVAWISFLVTIACVFGAAFSPWVAPHNPFDLATLDLDLLLAEQGHLRQAPNLLLAPGGGE